MSTTALQKISAALERAGFTAPSDRHANLFDLGFDSLLTALSVLELEREFGQKLKLPNDLKKCFTNLESIQSWIEEAKK